jgi:hypothetical protein
MWQRPVVIPGANPRSPQKGNQELVADPSAVYESAPRLDGLGRTIAAPALGMRARRDFARMVRLCSVSHLTRASARRAGQARPDTSTSAACA